MYWQIAATPHPYASSPVSASAQAGATVLPRTANNPTVQNQNQFDYGPYRLHLRDRVPSEDNRAPQHYRGPSTSISSIAHALVPPQTANNETVCNQNQATSCHSRPCLYNRNGNACGEPITCGTVPEHFSAAHGVKHIGSDLKIPCEWQNCGRKVLRHNFVRHVREKHLGHK
ncbi:hypothetical protein EDC04DRAFT_2772773, partial [Pisolithus marmoratus]